MINDNENDVPRLRNGHKYSKYKIKCRMCLSKLMVMCIKQHLSNFWSSVHEEIKQHWGWVEKALKKASI